MKTTNLTSIITPICLLCAILYLLWSAPTLTGFSYGFRSINKIASGFGTGTLVCPNGLTFNNEQMKFEVSKSKSDRTSKKTLTSDNWSISALNPQPQTAHANSGSINGVNLSSSLKDILIKGSESQDNICQSVNGKGNTLKINYISITGQCNTKDTIISFTSLDGKKGSFRGTIICSLIS